VLFICLGLAYKAEAEMVVQTPAQVEDFVIYQAMKQKVPVSLALGIARCESRFDPKAKNPNSTASGVFQFIRSTWHETTRRMKWTGAFDVFDPRLNVIAGIWLLKTDGATHWECYNEQMF
jgi:soluble lytic murein transglycosylase-like protein